MSDPFTPTFIEELVAQPDGKRRNVARLLEPLEGLPGIETHWLGPFHVQEETYYLPRLRLRGPPSYDPIRIGMFAALHGDEPAGAIASIHFLYNLTRHPPDAASFEITVYPVCNPSGFEDNTRQSRLGIDLNRQFWTSSPEQEVQLLEKELLTTHFHGLVQLHTDDTSRGVYGYVRGHTLTESLLRPALASMSRWLPRNVNATIDGFAARDSIIYDHFDGILAAPEVMKPIPFEIILETPHAAPLHLQGAAFTDALKTILQEYRRLAAYAQNI